MRQAGKKEGESVFNRKKKRPQGGAQEAAPCFARLRATIAFTACSAVG